MHRYPLVHGVCLKECTLKQEQLTIAKVSSVGHLNVEQYHCAQFGIWYATLVIQLILIKMPTGILIHTT